MLLPSEQRVVWVNEVLGTVAGEGSLIGVAPALCEDHQPGNPPLKMSGLARRLNDGEWLADPLLRHGVKTGLNHLVSCHDGLRPGGLDVDPWQRDWLTLHDVRALQTCDVRCLGQPV